MSEAAGLSDVFVLRLMFRLYGLPDQFRASQMDPGAAPNSSAAFYEKKRLLSHFAARKIPVKIWRDGKQIDYSKYLVISALALDTHPGACRALEGSSCGIHERRPLSCRTVPLHYSRIEGSAEADFEAFVGTPGYRCDTSQTAPMILSKGRIVEPQIIKARSDALALADRDRKWSEAIAREVMRGPAGGGRLARIDEIEASAQHGALTVSMRAGWKIAFDQGLMNFEEFDRLIAAQVTLIEQELCDVTLPPDCRETLREMRDEYRLERS